MHTLWLFFAWPDGGAWSNIVAVPPCAVLAAVLAFIFRDRLGRALKGWWARHLGHKDDLDAIHARLDAHADLLDHETPGGLGAVMDEVRRAVTAAESAHEAVRALGVIKPPPRRGGTEMRKAASAKDGGDGKAG